MYLSYTLLVCANLGHMQSFNLMTSHVVGMCDNVPEPCEHEVKYPDRSDCEWYYECNSEELSRKQCAKGTDSCHDDTACVFDIHTSSCIPPDGSFNCDYRCLTTGAFVTTEVPTSTEAIVTTLVDPTTSERLTTFEITTEEITTKSKFSTVDASTKVTDKPHTHEPDDLTSTHVDMTETSKKELTTECEHLSNADITTDDVTSPRTSAPEPGKIVNDFRELCLGFSCLSANQYGFV